MREGVSWFGARGSRRGRIKSTNHNVLVTSFVNVSPHSPSEWYQLFASPSISQLRSSVWGVRLYDSIKVFYEPGRFACLLSGPPAAAAELLCCALLCCPGVLFPPSYRQA